MGWTNSHLYEIRVGDVGLSTPDLDADWVADFLDARKAQLDNILEDIGTRKLVYLYDFGDGWQHTIKVERLADPNRVCFIRASSRFNKTNSRPRFMALHCGGLGCDGRPILTNR